MQGKKERQIWVCYVLAVFFTMLYFNCMTPYVADDWGYATAHSIPEIFKQEYHHYFTTNGRSLAHIMARFFLMNGKWIFNIANAGIYVVFTFLIYFHALYGRNLRFREKFTALLLIQMLFWLYTTNYGQVLLWLDGSCNYLWTGTIMMAYLIPFRLYLDKEEKVGGGVFPLMLIGGAASGWCNENTSGGVILLSVLYMIFYIIKKKKLQVWMFAGLLSSIVSFVIMIASPGNARRRTYFVDNRAWYHQLASHFQNIVNNVYENYRYLLFVIVILAVLAVYLHAEKEKIFCVGMYFVTSMAIFVALVFSPAGDGRPFFGGFAFLVIVCVGLLGIVLETERKFFSAVCIYLSLMAIPGTVNFINAVSDVTYCKIHSDRRDAYVKQERERGYSNIVVNLITPAPKTKYNAAYGLTDLINDPTQWPSTRYAQYYGVNAVTAVSNELFEKVFKNGNKELIDCRDIYKYLELIKDPKYTVLMAVNDDSSGAIDDKIVHAMSELGLKTDLSEKFRWSYIAVIHKGRVLYEEHENELLNYYKNIDGKNVEIVSSGKIYNKGNIASIKIDGYEYARNSIGLNFVIYDNEKGRVVDRVTFNTWDGLGAAR